jgi:hypothetical protein
MVISAFYGKSTLALIIPSATHDDPLLQARSPGEPGHKAPEKSGLYPNSPKVADDVIEAEKCILGMG